MLMTIKEAIDYLQPIADNAELANYNAALRTAIEAMRNVERLERTVAEYHERCNRQSSEIARSWEKIRSLEAELDRYKNMEDENARL